MPKDAPKSSPGVEFPPNEVLMKMKPDALDRLITKKTGIPVGPNRPDASRGRYRADLSTEYQGRDEEGDGFVFEVRTAMGEFTREPSLLPDDIVEKILRDPSQNPQACAKCDPNAACLTGSSPEEDMIADQTLMEELTVACKRRKMSRLKLIRILGLVDPPESEKSK